MNIYFCHSKSTDSGLFVIAKRRLNAKRLFSADSSIPVSKIRCTKVCVNVFENTEEIIDQGDARLGTYNLVYLDPFGRAI